jgi:hypothetical protein
MSYASIVTVRASRAKIDTAKLFDAQFTEATTSAVDQFLENSLSLNQHWTRLQADEELQPEIGRLLLIGYMSAVEGYMRTLIRKLVHLDPYCNQACSKLQVSFAAATYHSPDVLPDALLEETTFSTQGAIAPALEKFLGFKSLSAGTKNLLDEFDRLIQLRHCCTHRFGKLGVKNATVLGLPTHSALLEKPVLLDKAAMADIADLSFSLVKSINNDVFGFVLKRSATSKLAFHSSPGIGWTWIKARDRVRFKKYYELFCSRRDATPSPPPDDLYLLFRAEHKSVGKS